MSVWEKSLFSIGSDYDSLSTVSRDKAAENWPNVNGMGKKKTQAVCLHLSVTDDARVHTTFSLKQTDISSRDTHLL